MQVQIFNRGEAEIQASKLIRRKSHVELGEREAKMLLEMYPALQLTPSATNVNKLKAENAELKKQLEESLSVRQAHTAEEATEEARQVKEEVVDAVTPLKTTPKKRTHNKKK